MIEKLQERYDSIQTLSSDITSGNFTRFSRRTLTRLGGQEEAALDDM